MFPWRGSGGGNEPLGARLVRDGIGGLLHSVAFPFDFDDVGMVQEAVEDGGGGRHVPNELALLFEGTVGGHEGGAHFVAAHNDLEEVFAGLGRELRNAHVVND